MANLLEVYKLSKHFPVRTGLLRRRKTTVHAVDDVSFSVGRRETLGLVGESGCGKSTLARTILHLIQPTSGQVWFKGRNLSGMQPRERQKVRRGIQMVFQDPFGSLNPRLTVDRIVEEPLLAHGVDTRRTRVQRVEEMLSAVGLLPEHMKRFPHEFSGGQRQRIMLARALVLNPEMIIADEPVSALDVSVQAQMLNLLKRLQKQLELSYIFVSHDLGVIRYISHRVAVMYLGEIVELAPVKSLYTNPLHPYTRSLLSSIPIPDPRRRSRHKIILQGDVPSPLDSPSGCRLHTRCPRRMDICAREKPPTRVVEDQHTVACHLYRTGALWNPSVPESQPRPGPGAED